jgi:hypothetical protein
MVLEGMPGVTLIATGSHIEAWAFDATKKPHSLPQRAI